ncbi:hypothetical protein AB0C18_08875 [Nonomuraea muscovyensis]|uniref:hypothetical protein n=1 Tax=Nonomuraea muscovyensis TaxID=1124761 RepID=UPI0016167211|nr:hypothetical protein [Nonomuraea muscovyensis]MDF2706786.1 hypothetical protein [Nonomuraea muscovyensis]
MTLPVARTRDEALLYLDLTPCACGSVETPWESGVVGVAEQLAVAYAGTCADCGAGREYVFGLPERETAPKGWPTFGGPEPSQLIDAGEWLWVADQWASSVPPDPEEGARALAMARAAVEEVLKFVPDGADRVPDQAFWADRGLRVYTAEPGRFRVERLLVVKDAYRDA